MIKIKTRVEYPITKRLKQKITNVKREMLNLEKINLCCYSIDKTSKEPFLKYLLYKNGNEMVFPWISNFSKSKNLITYSENKVKDLFKNSDVSINFKGYIYDNSKELYVFFEIENVDNYVNLYPSDLLIFTTIHEILNEKKVFTYLISDEVYKFFIENSDISYIYDENMKLYEIPSVLYNGVEKEKSKFNILFGVTKSYVYALFGGYYYFSNLNSALRWSVWSNVNTSEKKLNYISNKKTGKHKAGVVMRNIVFLGNILIKPNNEKDISQITNELIQQKKEDNTNSFVSDRGGKWVDNYNSIIYNYPKKINDMILSIENLNDTKLLSIHEIDLSKFPEKFNKNMDLVDLL